jgi:hypothetical protein
MKAALPCLLCASLLALLAGVPLSAQTAAPESRSAAVLAPFDGAADAVFRAWLDKTDLGRRIKRDAATLRVARAADGTEMLLLGEGFQDVLVAATDERGKTVTTCIATGEGARMIFLSSRAPRVREP